MLFRLPPPIIGGGGAGAGAGPGAGAVVLILGIAFGSKWRRDAGSIGGVGDLII